MKTAIALLIFLFLPITVFAQFLIETPMGERRIRYELCDEHHNCKTVEEEVSYPICDEHHNCKTIIVSETQKPRIWDAEEVSNSGSFVFSIPGWL